MNSKEYLKIDECEAGYLYSVLARNFSVGIYETSLKGFIGLRNKLGNDFLFLELHWDTDKTFGTVKPLEKLEKCPIGLENWLTNNELFEWLKQKETELKPLR